MKNNTAKYVRGGAVNPNGPASGVKGMIIPILMITREVRTRNPLGRLSRKGTFPVLMT